MQSVRQYPARTLGDVTSRFVLGGKSPHFFAVVRLGCCIRETAEMITSGLPTMRKQSSKRDRVAFFQGKQRRGERPFHFSVPNASSTHILFTKATTLPSILSSPELVSATCNPACPVQRCSVLWTHKVVLFPSLCSDTLWSPCFQVSGSPGMPGRLPAEPS